MNLRRLYIVLFLLITQIVITPAFAENSLGSRLLGLDRQKQGKNSRVNKAGNNQSIYQTAVSAYQNKDFSTAYSLFLKLAKRGDATSQFNLAILYSRGEGAAVNHSSAFKWYERAARGGNVEAMYFLGAYYQQGLAISRNIKKAIYWLDRAYKKGHKGASRALAILQIVQPFSKELSSGKYQRLVSKFEGDKEPQVLNLLAHRYFYGISVGQNLPKALTYFQESSELNVIDSYKILGFMYGYGVGTNVNQESSMEYYQKSADYGNSYSLGKMGDYYLKEAGDTSIATAMQYYKISRDFGSHLSQLKLNELEKNVDTLQLNEIEEMYKIKKQEILDRQKEFVEQRSKQ